MRVLGLCVSGLVIAAGLTLAVPGGAQSPDPSYGLVTVTVTPARVAIGEPFEVRVRARVPKAAALRFPETPAAGGIIEPLDPRVIEDGPPGDVLDQTAVYRFVAWEPGTHTPLIAPVSVRIAARVREYTTSSGQVEVTSALPADSASQTPRGAREPLPIPGRGWQYGLVGLIALVSAWWYVRQRRQLRRAAAPAAIDAWADALGSFDALDRLALAASGERGRHMLGYVDAFREYLARRFPGMPTDADGFVAAIGATPFPVPVAQVADLFSRDAAVRFAARPVTADEATSTASAVRDFAAKIQLAWEAQQRAAARPERPKRR
ncbi:MAG: hypothetical protein FJ202_06110 [Gemmatimonadetes bacterium]|nr:hypothetical protein [Gemmatimonadota bacterium]